MNIQKLTSRQLEMETMEDGWHHGRGRAPERTRIARLFDILRRVVQSKRPVHGVRPEVDGGLIVEWRNLMLSAGRALDVNQGFDYALCLFGDRDIFWELRFSDDDYAVEQVCRALDDLAGGLGRLGFSEGAPS